MKKMICIALALLMVLPMLTACPAKGGEEEQTGVELTLVSSDTCTIVYNPDLYSTEGMTIFAKKIEDATGVAPTLKTSTSFIGAVRAEAGTILVGDISLKDTKDVLKTLRKKDYVAGIYGDYYLLGGHDNVTVAKALEYFAENVLDKVAEDGTLTVSSNDNYRYDGDYPIDNISVGSVPLYNCEIVRPAKAKPSELRTAKMLQSVLYEKTGYWLEIESAVRASAEGQIRIGVSICPDVTVADDHSYAVGVNGNHLQMAAGSVFGYEALQELLQYNVFGYKLDELHFNTSIAYNGNGANRATATLENDGDLRILYNNIWGGRGTGEDDNQRADMLLELYTAYNPNLICLQEYTPSLRSYMNSLFQKMGYKEVPTVPSKGFVPHKDSETGTRNPIYYKESEFELMEYGYCCLANLTFEEYPELLGRYTAAEIREFASKDRSKSVNWAILRVKATGELLLVANLHLFWQNENPKHDIARVIQMRKMRELLTTEAAAFLAKEGIAGNMPIIAGGDYNSRDISSYPSYTTMSKGAVPFVDLNFEAPEGERITKRINSTYPRFDRETGLWCDPALTTDGYNMAIDHIFAARETLNTFTVNRMNIVDELFAYLSSDHRPYFIDLEFTAAAAKLSK